MYTQIANANQYVAEELGQKSTRAIYLAIKEGVEKNRETIFAMNMQSYITRLGLIVANCYSEHLKKSNFYNAIDFMCKKLLKDKVLFKLLEAIELNDNSNNGKHSLKNVDLDIKECLHQYNTLIKKLVEKTGLDALNACYISMKKAENPRDVNLFGEKRDHIYGNVTGFDYQISLEDDYDIDPYKKQVITPLVIFWPKGHPGQLLDLKITNTDTKKSIYKKENIDVSNDEDNCTIKLKLTEKHLDRNVARIDVQLRLHKIVETTTTKGVIFKKKIVNKEDKEIGINTESVSQFFRPQNN